MFAGPKYASENGIHARTTPFIIGRCAAQNLSPLAQLHAREVRGGRSVSLRTLGLTNIFRTGIIVQTRFSFFPPTSTELSVSVRTSRSELVHTAMAPIGLALRPLSF